MSNVSPSPIRNPKSEIRNRIALFLVLILLILLTILVVKIIHVRSATPPESPESPESPAPPASPPAVSEPNLRPTRPDLLQLLTNPDRLAASLPPGAAPLDHEPGNLPVPPRSEILLRFQTHISGGGDEETCVRSIRDTSLESAASFYRRALVAAGEKFTEQTPAPLVIRLTRQHPDGSLMIRLRQTGSEVRAVIQLRYTMNQEKNAPRSSPRTQREK
ncbi:MAG: hypothetical protein ACYC26_10225 [Phycisphaerales bacterium]